MTYAASQARTLTAAIVEAIGQAIGSEALARGQQAIAIGRDGRLSGPELIAALARGIRKSGIAVIDVGCVTTPMVYFAAYHLNTHCAVVLTGSHNPPEYNGLKIVLGGETLYGEAIQALRTRIEQNDFSEGCGSYSQQDISAAYIARIVSDVKLNRPMTVTVDCGNGRGGCLCCRSVPPARMHRTGNVLRGGWTLSKSSSRPIRSRKFAGFDRRLAR